MELGTGTWCEAIPRRRGAGSSVRWRRAGGPHSGSSCRKWSCGAVARAKGKEEGQGGPMRAVLISVVLLAACESYGSGPSNNTPPPFYVANQGSSTFSVFTTDDTGNATPALTIAGTNTGLNSPEGIVVDPTGIVLVTSVSPPRILVFAAHAVGDVAPIASIVGSNTGLVQPKALALDASGRLYVADAGANSIFIFANGASGNVAPLGTITGSNTALSGPAGLCFDLRDRLYVANASGNYVTIYGAGASGNVRPADTVAGPSTLLNAPSGIALDPGGQLFVANSGASSVTVYESGARGNAAPIDTIAGTNTGLDQPEGVALDPGGRIYVANSAVTSHQYRITVYGAGASGDIAPLATLAGNNTGLSVPTHLSFCWTVACAIARTSSAGTQEPAL